MGRQRNRRDDHVVDNKVFADFITVSENLALITLLSCWLRHSASGSSLISFSPVTCNFMPTMLFMVR